MIVLSNNSVVSNVLFKNKSFLKYFNFFPILSHFVFMVREEKEGFVRRIDFEVEGKGRT